MNWYVLGEMLFPSGQPEAKSRLYGIEMLTVWLMLAAFFGLAAAYLWGRRLHREWVAKRLRSAAEAQHTSPSAIHEGMPAHLEVITREGLRQGTAIVRAVHHRVIALSMPTDPQGNTIEIGTPLMVGLVGETAAYRFQTSVQDRRIVGGVPTLFVPCPPWIERVQRRAFFRVPVHLPTVVSPLATSAENEETGVETPVYRAVIEDLSGGGIRLKMTQPLTSGTRLRIRLPLYIYEEDSAVSNSLETVTFEARVLLCRFPSGAAQSSPTQPVRLHCEFLYISEEARNLIIRYCETVQRRTMRIAKTAED